MRIFVLQEEDEQGRIFATLESAQQQQFNWEVLVMEPNNAGEYETVETWSKCPDCKVWFVPPEPYLDHWTRQYCPAHSAAARCNQATPEYLALFTQRYGGK